MKKADKIEYGSERGLACPKKNKVRFGSGKKGGRQGRRKKRERDAPDQFG